MDQASQKVLNFPLVFHGHQPCGNFSHTIDVAFKLSYSPLIEWLDRYPKVKAGLHYSGYLLEWLAENKPDYIKTVRKLVERKQVEIIGGAYYEPIIAVIPDEDKLGQIFLLRDYVKELFGVEPKGFWLAERVWEPHLAKLLGEEAKLKYIFIDDYHLRMNGLSEEETFYTYITEEQGAKIIVVPINEPLRYLTPWKPVAKTLEYLETNASTEPDRLICLIDDMEKFGLWATTHKICYQEGYDGTPWMDKMFTLVERTPWIKSLTLSEYFDKFEPRGLIYMPTASYDKMSYWVLPTPERINLEELLKLARSKKLDQSENLLKFLRGGFWRQFLVKYYEANNMHKKMLYVREKLRHLEREWGKSEHTKKASREIYKAQVNDPYWHGQFGGVYFAFMRHNIYHYLIEAEKVIEKGYESHQKITPFIHPYDIDKDGRDEIIVETSMITLYLHPFRGGSVFEMDHKVKGINILNAFQRRKEAYYTDELNYVADRWRRYAFYDHFVKDEITLEELVKDTYEELGTFLSTHYDVEAEPPEKSVMVKLSAEGQVKQDQQMVPIIITKEFELVEDKNELKITFTVENMGEDTLKLCHLTEIPIYLTGDLNKIAFKCDKKESEIRTDEALSGKSVQMIAGDMDATVKIGLSDMKAIFKYNLNTYATTNGGYDTLYQGTVVSFITPIKLEPEKSTSFKMTISLS